MSDEERILKAIIKFRLVVEAFTRAVNELNKELENVSKIVLGD